MPEWQRRSYVALLAVLLGGLALACHPRYRHVDGVHSWSDNENVCIEVYTEEPTDFQATFNRLSLVLENESFGWETRETLNFIVEPDDECSEVPNREDFEIEFRLRESGDYGPCSNNFICIVWEESNGQHGDPESTDYEKVSIHFTQTELNYTEENLWSSRVNHEFGHAAGLADPVADEEDRQEPTSPYEDANTCWVEISPGLVVPVLSIMHRGYCDNLPPPAEFPWPSEHDFNAFESRVVPYP